MKIRQTILSVLTASAMLLTLTACSGDTTPVTFLETPSSLTSESTASSETSGIILPFLPVQPSSSSEEEPIDPSTLSESPAVDFEYERNENDELTITKYVGNNSAVKIPARIDGAKVIGIENYAFAGCEWLRVISIPDEIERIGESILGSCNADIFYQGETYSSSQYDDLKQNVFINNMPDTPASDFDYHVNDLSNTIAVDGYNGDDEIVKIPSTIDGKTVEIICDTNAMTGMVRFKCGKNTKVLIIPESVTGIGIYAFYSQYGFTEFRVDENNQHFASQDGAIFSKDMTGLIWYPGSRKEKFTIPDSVTYIDEFAFKYSDELTDIEVDKNNPNYSSKDGVMYSKDMTELMLCPDGRSGKFTIPDGVTRIGKRAFDDCTKLTEISIPNSVTEIGLGAFGGCTGLTSITIPNSVTEMEGGTIYIPSRRGICNYTGIFQGCTGLKNVTLPNSVEVITSDLFRDCTGLTSITLPEGVTTIIGGAFSYCKNLKTITLPNSIVTIQYQAFEECPTDFVYQGKTYTFLQFDDLLEELTAFDYEYNDELGGYEITKYKGYNYDIKIPDKHAGKKVVKISGYKKGLSSKGAFEDCADITSITIPDSITEIGSQAFHKCTGLETVTIPDSVTKIDSWAFAGCTGLESVTIPESVKEIGWNAFGDCKGLTSITIPNGVTTIEMSAFDGCSGLTRVTIPNSVTEIGVDAFFGCTGLKSITIPNSVTVIGYNAFGACRGLTDVKISDGVKIIGNHAFSSCTGLTSIEIPESVTDIGDTAFYDCTGLETVKIPDSVIRLGYGSFDGTDATIYYKGKKYTPNAYGSYDNLYNYMFVQM